MTEENTATATAEVAPVEDNKITEATASTEENDATGTDDNADASTATKDEGKEAKGKDKKEKTVPLARFLKQNSELQTARQRAAELEALVANGGKAEAKPLTAEDIERVANEKAASIAAANKFNEKSNEIYAGGVKAYSKAEFDNAIDTIKTVGLIPADMIDVLADLGDGHKILKHIADDLDKAESLFALSPTKRAIELTKLHSKLTSPAIKKQISNAPAPVNPINGAVNPPAIDIYDKKLSTAERIKEMQRQERAAREKKYGKR